MGGRSEGKVLYGYAVTVYGFTVHRYTVRGFIYFSILNTAL